jgi:hypothetical protein
VQELLNEYDVVDGMDIGLSLISCQLVFASRAGEGDFLRGNILIGDEVYHPINIPGFGIRE